MSTTSKLLNQVRELGAELGHNRYPAEAVKEAYKKAEQWGGELAVRALEEGFKKGVKEREDTSFGFSKYGKEKTLKDARKMMDKVGGKVKKSTDDLPGDGYLDDVLGDL